MAHDGCFPEHNITPVRCSLRICFGAALKVLFLVVRRLEWLIVATLSLAKLRKLVLLLLQLFVQPFRSTILVYASVTPGSSSSGFS